MRVTDWRPGQTRAVEHDGNGWAPPPCRAPALGALWCRRSPTTGWDGEPWILPHTGPPGPRAGTPGASPVARAIPRSHPAEGRCARRARDGNRQSVGPGGRRAGRRSRGLVLRHRAGHPGRVRGPRAARGVRRVAPGAGVAGDGPGPASRLRRTWPVLRERLRYPTAVDLGAANLVAAASPSRQVTWACAALVFQTSARFRCAGLRLSRPDLLGAPRARDPAPDVRAGRGPARSPARPAAAARRPELVEPGGRLRQPIPLDPIQTRRAHRADPSPNRSPAASSGAARWPVETDHARRRSPPPPHRPEPPRPRAAPVFGA